MDLMKNIANEMYSQFFKNQDFKKLSKDCKISIIYSFLHKAFLLGKGSNIERIDQEYPLKYIKNCNCH